MLMLLVQLPRSALDQLQRGQLAPGVDVLLGTNANEGRSESGSVLINSS